jgi:hypothetical protein
MVLHKGRKPRISLTRDTEHTLWPLYLVAKQLVQACQPTEESLMPIVSRLDAENRCPLEALIIRRILPRSKLLNRSRNRSQCPLTMVGQAVWASLKLFSIFLSLLV